jgi:hypothetical protein
MRRFATVPVLALAFAVACDKRPTSPDRAQPAVGGRPSYQVVPQQGPSDQSCVGTLPPGTYQNVFVPPGASCFLSNSTLTGNLVALPGSKELTTQNNRIAGSIQADSVVNAVSLFQDEVGGNVEISDGPGSFYGALNLTLSQGNIHLIKNSGSLFVRGNRLLGGNLKVEDNAVFFIMFVFENDVRQNIQVFKNVNFGPGFKNVTFNTAGESVQCKENAPPFIGTPNVAPKLEGQCAVPPTPF